MRKLRYKKGESPAQGHTGRKEAGVGPEDGQSVPGPKLQTPAPS